MDIQNIEWSSLPFGYFKTEYNVRCYNRLGAWGKIEVSSSEYINIHMAATCLHYGQEAFEGMKVFRGADDKIRIFRWEENAKRMRRSAEGVMMAEVPDELFYGMIEKVVKLNVEFIPPYGSGAALYIRPLLIGTGPQVGVKPADEYLFMIFVGPVGPYFKEGFHPVRMQIVRDYDRCAPLGTGHIKVGGNYAASLKPAARAKAEGFASVIFLEAKEKKYIDEAGPANFFGIKGKKYVTPDSHSILPSITNMSLRTLAKDMGLEVELRHVTVEELGEFDEAGACGTAAIISPIREIEDRDTGKVFTYGDGEAGPITTALYNKLRAIQYGEDPDPYGWTSIIDE